MAEKTRRPSYFGSTKINNSFDVVDAVANEQGGVATVFVKSGDDFIRVATDVKKDDGSRAIGTVLDPKGPVIGVIRKGEASYRRREHPRQALRDWLRADPRPSE